ncbi:MAG: flagellar basal body-associated FliL family protein [Niveispirillum sp.]|uniref:flagellar basal body-associated FliL family protein n=1 Tax=Niveispirillum sp. TaxID=1917217 RepID=UPI003BA67D6C
MTGAAYDRRALLRLGMGLMVGVAMPLPVRAEGGVDPVLDDPKLRFINVPPLLLPGRERFAFIRIVMRLVVRRTEKLPLEAALVRDYMPRIVGLLTEQLPEDENLTRTSGPNDLMAMKRHVRDLANNIIGQPVIEDVLIVSFLTG